MESPVQSNENAILPQAGINTDPSSNVVDIELIKNSFRTLQGLFPFATGGVVGYASSKDLGTGIFAAVASLVVWTVVNALFLIYLFLRRKQEGQLREQEARLRQREICLDDSWQEFLIVSEIHQSDRKKIRQLLGRLRNETFAQLYAHNENLIDEQVRAKIFLPECNNGNQGYAYSLKVPDASFRIHITEASEQLLEFNPGQGVAGFCFKERRYVRAIMVDGEWNPRFELTTRQYSEIHPDLRWVVGLPLIDPRHMNCILGVLILDGLVHDIEGVVIDDRVATVTPIAQAIATILSKVPRTKVKVCQKGL